jgi:hypothetical protein
MTVGILNGNTYGIYTVSASITPVAVNTITAAEQTFATAAIATLKLRTTDIILNVTPPSDLAGVSLTYARVSAADTIAIKFVNPTVGSVTPPAGVYEFVVLRPESNAPAVAIGD